MSTKQIDEVLRGLSARHNGRLTPNIVIEAAKSKKSPLHAYFTWDDKAAGLKWRIEQARELIQSVKVRTTITNHRVQAPEFIRDPAVASSRTQGYVSLGRLRTDEDMAREAVVAEFSRAASALSRAKAVAAALGLEDAIEDLRSGVMSLLDRVQQPQASA